MPTMRDRASASAGRAIRDRRAGDPRARARLGPHQSTSLWNLSQRFAHQGRTVSGSFISSSSGSRGDWNHRCHRPRGSRLETGRPRWRRLAREPLRTLRLVPTRGFLCLSSDPQGDRHLVRRRVCRLHDCTGHGAGASSRRVVGRRRRTAYVCGHHDLQCACATVVRERAIWSPCSASAGSAISACSMPRKWDFAPSPSPAAKTRSRSRKLGAAHYIDSQATDPAAELIKLGGAKIVLATVTNGDAMAATLGGLGPNGSLLVLGAADDFKVSPLLLLSGKRSVKGWYSGTSIDSQDTLAFSVQSGVRSMNEVFPLERAPEAYERMMSGKARFRVVLTTGQ